MKTDPRMVLWREGNRQRIMMTSTGPLIAYEGEWVMVVVGKNLDECVQQFCPMLRLRGEFEPEPTK